MMRSKGFLLGLGACLSAMVLAGGADGQDVSMHRSGFNEALIERPIENIDDGAHSYVRVHPAELKAIHPPKFGGPAVAEYELAVENIHDVELKRIVLHGTIFPGAKGLSSDGFPLVVDARNVSVRPGERHVAKILVPVEGEALGDAAALELHRQAINVDQLDFKELAAGNLPAGPAAPPGGGHQQAAI
ncbi:MAG: hypothetical protein MK186_14345 [Henriciella sp.]|nr:hypothetical protein [Henriciella sp.]